MIIDLPEPRDIDIGSGIRVGTKLKSKYKNPLVKAILSARGDDTGRDRTDSLDDTRSRMSSVPGNDSEFRANDRRVQIPQWLLLFLIIQGAGIIWWAATMQSDLRYQEREKIRIEGKIDTQSGQMEQEIKLYDLQRQKDVDRVRDQVRDEVANQLLSRGIIRVQPTP